MAGRYRTDGSAAYDVNTTARHRNTAQPIQRPQRLPDAPARNRPIHKTRAKTAVAPFTLLGTAAVAALLLLALFSYIGLYEAKSEAAELQSQLNELTEEQAFLQSKYEQSVDMQQIEQRAKELGLRQPGAAQTIYVGIGGSNAAQTFTAPQERNFIEKIFDALRGAFSDALEYFS